MMQECDFRIETIVSIDLCGYCYLMELDEIGTHRALMKCYSEKLAPIVASHAGNIIKQTGDGALITFPDVSCAAHAMIDFQQRIAVGSESDPLVRSLIFRAGIHLAPIIFEGGDVYGKGVNLAVRLQQAAEPGSIYISKLAHTDLEGSISQKFEYAGKRSLRNIRCPVSFYCWRNLRSTPWSLRSLSRTVAVRDERRPSDVGIFQ